MLWWCRLMEQHFSWKSGSVSILCFYWQEAALTLTLIQPASKWMHWATLWRHSDLFWAATSTCSLVIPFLNKSLLTVLLQFVRGRPGPLLNPGTSQCNNACRGMRWWSIRITCPSQQSLLSLSMTRGCSLRKLKESTRKGSDDKMSAGCIFAKVYATDNRTSEHFYMIAYHCCIVTGFNSGCGWHIRPSSEESCWLWV